MVNWSDVVSVGVGVLDEDHKLILVVAEALQRALIQRERRLAQAGGEVLVEACRAHFRREEELLSAAAFPSLDEHRLGHIVCLETIDQMRQDVERGLWLPAQARLGEVIDLVKHRLLVEDGEYGRWLKRHHLVPVYRDLAFAGWEAETERV